MAYTEEQLALRIKEKYPQYQGIENSELVSKVLDKYPEYGAQLSEKEQRKNTLRDVGKNVSNVLMQQGPIGPYSAISPAFSPETAEGQKLIAAGVAQGTLSSAAGITQAVGEVEKIKTGLMQKAEERLLESEGRLPRAIGALFNVRRLMKEGASEKAFENAERIRNISRDVDKVLDIDPEVANTFQGQVLRGFGNFGSFLGPGIAGKVVGLGGTALTGINLANTYGQVSTESIMDAEDTFGKSYTEMTEDERNQASLAAAGHGITGTALNFFGARFSVPWMRGFLFDNKKVPVGELRKLSDQMKSVGQGALKGFMGEGFTESLEGASVDAFAKALYDDDRMLMSFDTLKKRMNEFLIGGIIGGTVRGSGTALEIAASGPLIREQAVQTQPEEYTKEPEQLGNRQEYTVQYIDEATGATLTDTVEATSEAEARKIFEDGFASGSTIIGTGFELVSVNPKDAPAPKPTPTPGPGPTEQPRLPEITADAARIPAVMERAAPLFEKIKAGEPITVQDSQALAGVVDSELPVSVFTAEQVEARPILSNEQMKTKLSDNKVDFVGKENFKVPVKDGTFVGLRLDIPAYDRPKDGGEPAFIVSVHEASPTGESFQAGAVAGYDSAAVIEDATFGIGKDVTGQKVTLGIASGKPKSTIATMRGKYVDMSPEQAYAELKENLDNPEWTQVGMDPERRGYFYDRKTMREIVGADRVVQVGNMVLAQNVKYGPTPANEFVSRLTPGLVVGEPDVTAEAAKVTREYELLESPFILDYQGPPAEDMTLPDYESLHYLVPKSKQPILNQAIESGAVDNLANQLVAETEEMLQDPSVAAGKGWYGRMRVRLEEIFGKDNVLFTHLLGTTSAQTPVEENFKVSVDLYNRFKAGEFDAQIKEYLRLRGMMQAGTLGDLLIRLRVKDSNGNVYTEERVKKSKGSALLSRAAEHFDLIPAKTTGKKYGTNSYPALKALAQVWFEERTSPERMTPKTPQFAMNLNGESLEATIDVWAARLMRRIIYKDQDGSRILPAEETAVNNEDFALSQVVFRRAAQKLDMNPDDLQAIVWFGEKKIWDENGWTGSAGALKSSFDEPAAVFYPEDGSTRSESDANLILKFLATERKVRRDIDFPNEITEATKANNRKEYDEYIRQSVIADFIESTGRGTLYEGSTVESDRKRQVTRAINRLRSYDGTVRYKSGTRKEPRRSLKVIRRGPVLDTKQFSSIAESNKKSNKFGASVDVLSPAEYEGHDIIITGSGPGATVTIAISPSGELTSVTKSSKATGADVYAAFDMAISTGKVKYLNGFETVLPHKYAALGFEPVARLKFNPEFQPDGWDYNTYRKYNNGQPDVVFMRFTGNLGGTYDPVGFPEVQTYEAGLELAAQDVTAEAGTVLRPDEQPVEGGFNSQAEMRKYINEEFLPIAEKLGIDIVPNFAAPVARYNVTQRAIEYNPRELFKQSQDYIRSAMREEIIHAAMHKVLMNRSKTASPNQAWLNFFEKVGKDLTPEQRQAIEQVYRNLSDDVSYGAEYTRALIQQQLYGRVTEQDLRFGPAFDKIKQLIKSVQIYISHALKGMSDERIEAAAVIKESADLLRGVDPTARPANQATIDAANKQVQEDSGILTAEAATELAKPPKKKKKKKGPLSFMDKYINTADTVLRRIHPEIANLFQRYVHSIDKKKFDALKRTKPFIERYNKIKNKKDQRRLKQLLMYSPLEAGQEGDIKLIAERDALLRKYDMYNLYKTNIVPVLFRIRSEAQEQGVDVGFLEGYFPRRVIDYEGLRESFGRPIAKDFRSYVDEINRQRRKRNLEQGKNEPLVEYGSEEEALIFEKYIRNGDYVKRGVKTSKPRAANQRTIEFIPDKYLDFYDDPGSALEYYISSMIHATETKRVFGERYVTDGEDVRLAGEMGPLLQDLMDRGEINEEAAFRTLPHVARMVLNSANRENVFLGNMRQFSYLTTMVEFTSTISNLYDLPFVMERAGLLNTLNAIISPKYLRLADYGIDNDRISDEFRDEKNFLTQSVKLGLKASGFTRLDQLLKETSLNAQYAKLRKDAQAYYKNRNSNRSKRFRTTIEAAVGKEQADATIAALKKGDRDNALVRDVVIRESLEKTQPITKMQTPLGAAANPNSRIAYQMKSFMVTQLNYVRNEYLADIFSGDRQRATQGTIRLARLMGFMILLGLPVDALKDFLAGRLGYMSDYMFNSIFRLAGVSKYQVYQTKKEGIGSALVGYVTPITVQQFMDYTAEFQRVTSGDRALTASKLVSIAPFSDVLNRMFGFQKEKERREYIRRAREGELPTFIPPGSL